MTNNIKNLDQDKLVKDVLDSPSLQAQALDLNTRKQLFDKGIDSKGKSLGTYSPYTIQIKKITGLPTDRVTLYQYGDFYKSFTFKNQDTDFIISADTQKEDNDLAEMYGDDILGLTDESIEEILPEIKESILEKIRKHITA